MKVARLGKCIGIGQSSKSNHALKIIQDIESIGIYALFLVLEAMLGCCMVGNSFTKAVHLNLKLRAKFS
jgi:hypothetical protein